MFARVVECQAKKGHADGVAARVTTEVVPVLQKQPSFVDFVALADEEIPERLLCISLWTSSPDTDNYHHDHYDTIVGLLRPLLASAPALETFAVHTSTVHRIAVRKAA